MQSRTVASLRLSKSMSELFAAIKAYIGSTYRLRSILAGFAMRVMFLRKTWMKKPMRKFLNACRMVFSKQL